MRALVIASILLLGACASNFPVEDKQPQAAATTASHPGALLLVSLEDGQLIMQHIDVDAEFCMKSNADPATRCFARGAAIYDPTTDTVVAYQLETSELDLYAKRP